MSISITIQDVTPIPPYASRIPHHSSADNIFHLLSLTLLVSRCGFLRRLHKPYYILPILYSYFISLRIVFEQYSPTSARPSTGKNDRALFEYKQVTEAGKSSSAS